MASPITDILESIQPDPRPEIPEMVSIGVIKMSQDEERPRVPLALPIGGDVEGAAGFTINLPGCPDRAALLQQAISVRMACAVDVNLLRIHAIDLVGVGIHFRHLGGLSRDVFSARELVTDSRSLSALLGELLDDAKTRNLEKIVHKFADIREYNRETEAMEPLHLILISSFPGLWTEEQLSTLRQLITLGRRTGHWFVVHRDNQQIAMGSKDLSEVACETVSDLSVIRKVADGFVISNSPVVAAFHRDWQAIPDGLVSPLPENHLDTVLHKLHDKKIESSSKHNGIRVPIGTCAGRQFQFVLGHDSGVYHALIGGTTGSGKSVLLHNIIVGLIENYSKEEVQLVLMDLKEGIEFVHYQDHPMTWRFLHGTDAGEGIGVLGEVQKLITDRGSSFRDAKVNDISRYNSTSVEPMPRVVVIVDEFQRLFAGRYQEQTKINTMLEDLAKRGRSYGIHLIMCSQSLAQSPLAKTTRNVFGLRILLRISAAECPLFFDDYSNTAPSCLNHAGQAIFNSSNGLKDANTEVLVKNIRLDEIPRRIGND